MKRVTRVASTPAVRDSSKTFTPVDMYSSLDALLGSTVIDAVVMPAEVSRSVDNYLLLTVNLQSGRKVRLIFVAAEVKRPCPRDTDMLEVDDFFDMDEYKARRLDKAFELLTFGEEENMD